MAFGDTKLFEGGKGQLSQIAGFENRFEEGDEGHLDLRLRLIPPGTDRTVSIMAATIRQAGVVLPKDPEIVGKTIRIHFKKAIAPLAIIAAAIALGLVLLLVSFALFKNAPQVLGIPGFIWPILLAVAVILVLTIVGLILVGKARQGILKAVEG